MSPSKTQSSFYRRLYLAHLIANGIASVPAIIAATGMPRRTAQDTLKALEELDMRCEFRPAAGERHNSGRYEITDWGPIDRDWVARHAERLRRTLGYPALS
ncbi:helix-turn-helix domain-containing protein [Halomonas sp. MCCC 1A17488]|uniref:Helix-turn-helix domain-containing protein n=1 Tax=Billgrantia sulfidoxydans TaxID=2733484 RepID=A0ABX7W300_9GAMM|nr:MULTISPECIES: winged helix-turn-helix domain-containing protein [Halomonas]MCE8015693.1 helix-turn-helix domain-containing protein [Halomonas sp. MCCC 1A17488]MCG3239026.1 helix-turn-helix domain-containing protein [Halomonas sp. MCCC 1A17488]QPP51023.1 winged helix-turn-helix domain-containing protein [Halomonas sp. SS10-MC5]QTP54535.1 helix-turn-helix domain-containing protein [Halomonas sulfidoxydans]